LPNGNWNVVKAVKIENGKASVMLKPGTSIWTWHACYKCRYLCRTCK
jgi:hypothetical protein